MDFLGEFGCRDCSMVFRSIALLEKHKSLFCIGSDIGDPVALRQRQEHIVRGGGRSLQPRQTWTPDLVRPRGQRTHHQRNCRWKSSDAEPKRDRVEVKPATSTPENIALRNLTDEIMNGEACSCRAAEQRSEDRRSEDQRSEDQRSEDRRSDGPAFHKLRTSIEGSLSYWAKWTTDTEVCGYGAPAAERREMNEVHERQLAQIQAHSQQLELQREDLACQLGALAGHSDHRHLETLLMELREQEERNQDTLQKLAEQLNTLRTGVKEVSDLQNPGPTQEEDMKRHHHVTFDLISSINGPLSTQIKALRLAYMHSGGCDPAVLAQMHDFQAQAQTLEQNQPGAGAKSKRKKMGLPQWSHGWEVQAVEQENLRLEEEILRLLLARERQCGQEAAVGTGFQLIQRDHLHHMASMQAEVESLRREMERTRGTPRNHRQPPPPPPPPPFPAHHPALHPLAYIHAPPALRQPRPQSSGLGRYQMEPLVSLGPAPYDPVSGFVIFYDLVLGVDATLSVLRLVAALYSGGQELGRPTLLPPVHCQPGGERSSSHLVLPGNYALLSVKQPVTRMQPSPSLSLVVEVQAVGGVDVYGQEVQRLVSRGWARLELFDQHNQVQSGHWRAPVRCLPVRPSLSPAQLNALPQVGTMELCVRLVNARDGDIQTLAEPVPRSQYKYPAVVPTQPVILQGNPNPTLQPTTANQLLSLLPDADHEDPPPTEGTSHR